MRKSRSMIVAGGFAAALLLPACTFDSGDPCVELGAPTDVEKAAAAQGAEVEVEVDGTFGTTECVVQRGRWVDAGSDD